MTFQLDTCAIANVSHFKYLGRTITNNDDDFPAILHNISRARGQWCRIKRILTNQDATPRMMSRFYLSIVQSSLLYGSESWTLNQTTRRMLHSFHNMCARGIAKMHSRQNDDGTWTLVDMTLVRECSSLQPITDYIQQRKANLLPYATTRHIYQTCIRSLPLSTNSRQITWWTTPNSTINPDNNNTDNGSDQN